MQKQFKSSDIVFISDTHIGHANIIKYCRRPFEYPDTELMDLTMLNYMKDADDAGKTIIHCGDFVFNPKTILEISWRPKGEHIILLGNHDKNANKEGKYRKLYREFFHHIIGHSKNWRIDFTMIEVDEVPIMLSHAPQDHLINAAYNVHGHVHNNARQQSPRHLNVSVEMIDYKPVSIQQAIALYA